MLRAFCLPLIPVDKIVSSLLVHYSHPISGKTISKHRLAQATIYVVLFLLHFTKICTDDILENLIKRDLLSYKFSRPFSEDTS